MKTYSECHCKLEASLDGGNCEFETGQCLCATNVAGVKCDVCEDTYFGWPECTESNIQNNYWNIWLLKHIYLLRMWL